MPSQTSLYATSAVIRSSPTTTRRGAGTPLSERQRAVCGTSPSVQPTRGWAASSAPAVGDSAARAWPAVAPDGGVLRADGAWPVSLAAVSPVVVVRRGSGVCISSSFAGGRARGEVPTRWRHLATGH